MSKVLIWKKDGKPNFSGERFEIFPVYWDKRERRWVESETGRKFGLKHPVTGRVVGLRKAPEAYGVLLEIENFEEASPDVETRVVMGTPTLGIVDANRGKTFDSDEEE
jgi:hypothetical protein